MQQQMRQPRTLARHGASGAGRPAVAGGRVIRGQGALGPEAGQLMRRGTPGAVEFASLPSALARPAWQRQRQHQLVRTACAQRQQCSSSVIGTSNVEQQ
jgi:hypothetical protein